MTSSPGLPADPEAAPRPLARRDPLDGLDRLDRRAVSYCKIWDLVAPGEDCPACENSFEDALARAKGGR